MKKILILFILSTLLINVKAQIKVSALPAATTVNSSDLFLLVQVGTSKKLPYSVLASNLSITASEGVLKTGNNLTLGGVQYLPIGITSTTPTATFSYFNAAPNYRGIILNNTTSSMFFKTTNFVLYPNKAMLQVNNYDNSYQLPFMFDSTGLWVNAIFDTTHFGDWHFVPKKWVLDQISNHQFDWNWTTNINGSGDHYLELTSLNGTGFPRGIIYIDSTGYIAEAVRSFDGQNTVAKITGYNAFNYGYPFQDYYVTGKLESNFSHYSQDSTGIFAVDVDTSLHKPTSLVQFDQMMKYVDDHAGGSYTASNGITKVGNDFQMQDWDSQNGIKNIQVNNGSIGLFIDSSTNSVTLISSAKSSLNAVYFEVDSNKIQTEIDNYDATNNVIIIQDTSGISCDADTALHTPTTLMQYQHVMDQIHAIVGVPEIGSGNYKIGTGAFPNTLGSGDNIAFGTSSMNDANGASYNIGIGNYSLYHHVYGDDDIGIGYEALFSNTYSSGNTAIGDHALSKITTGEDNTALGRHAGDSARASGGIFIGSYAGNGELYKTRNNAFWLDSRTGQDSAHSYMNGTIGSTLRINANVGINQHPDASAKLAVAGKIFATDTIKAPYTPIVITGTDTTGSVPSKKGNIFVDDSGNVYVSKNSSRGGWVKLNWIVLILFRRKYLNLIKR